MQFLPLTFIELGQLFTENINYLNVVMFLIYFIFKVSNSLQIKQCLTTEKSPSRIIRQH